MKKDILNKNKKRKDLSSIFLIVFAALFAAVVAHSFFSGHGTDAKGIMGGVMPTVTKPVELSFSDVLRRAPEIQTMKIRDNQATGVLQDDANVNRFTDFVRRYCVKSQFILVTHRKGTMEACDRMYGVTMQERGISKILSMRLSET